MSVSVAEQRLVGRITGGHVDDLEPTVARALLSVGGSWSVISTNTNAVAFCGYLINASSGNVTLTLPATPAEGDQVSVCDVYKKATTNVITIARNSENIESSATDLVLNSNGSGFTLVYVDSTVGWKIVSEIGS